MRILALDTGTKTGWALYHPNWPGPESGVQEFKSSRGESPAMRFLRFRSWLEELFQHKPDLILYEKAHHRGGAATEFCVGLTTRVQEAAAVLGINYEGVHTGTLKKHTTGAGKASKQDMINAARNRWGIEPIDDNHGDALCLLAYGVDTYIVKGGIDENI